MASAEAVLFLEDEAPEIVGHGQAGLDLDRLVDVVEGLVEPALEDIEPGQIEVGELPVLVGQVGQGLAELGFGLGQPVHFLVDGAQVVVGLGELGIDLQALLVGLGGFVEAAPHGMGQAERVPGKIVVRVEGQGLDQIFRRVLDVVLVEIEQAQIVLVLGIFLARPLDLRLRRRAKGKPGADDQDRHDFGSHPIPPCLGIPGRHSALSARDIRSSTAFLGSLPR